MGAVAVAAGEYLCLSAPALSFQAPKAMDDPQNNRQKLILEAARLSERNLEAELAISIAADQRAAGLCGFLITALSIVASFSGHVQNKAGVFFSIFLLMIALILAGMSMRSIKMRAPGARFSDCEDEISKKVPIEDLMMAYGQFNDLHSRENRAKISRNARLFNGSLAFSFSSVVIFSMIRLVE